MRKKATIFARKETVKRDWYIVDAKGKVLGRVATKIATFLRGKNKVTFTPNVDCGDFVVVINADKIAFTGKKDEQKIYFSHSDYPGGAKLVTLADMLAKKPTKVITHAVAGMLPKNRLGRKLIKKLKVYVGAEHPHQAQNPQKLEV